MVVIVSLLLLRLALFFFKSLLRRFGEDNDQHLVDFGENPSSFIPPPPKSTQCSPHRRDILARMRSVLLLFSLSLYPNFLYLYV